jgi:hypothetical protein
MPEELHPNVREMRADETRVGSRAAGAELRGGSEVITIRSSTEPATWLSVLPEALLESAAWSLQSLAICG